MVVEREDNKGTVVSDNVIRTSLIDEKCGFVHFKDFSTAVPSSLQCTVLYQGSLK